MKQGEDHRREWGAEGREAVSEESSRTSLACLWQHFAMSCNLWLEPGGWGRRTKQTTTNTSSQTQLINIIDRHIHANRSSKHVREKSETRRDENDNDNDNLKKGLGCRAENKWRFANGVVGEWANTGSFKNQSPVTVTVCWKNLGQILSTSGNDRGNRFNDETGETLTTCFSHLFFYVLQVCDSCPRWNFTQVSLTEHDNDKGLILQTFRMGSSSNNDISEKFLNFGSTIRVLLRMLSPWSCFNLYFCVFIHISELLFELLRSRSLAFKMQCWRLSLIWWPCGLAQYLRCTADNGSASCSLNLFAPLG